MSKQPQEVPYVYRKGYKNIMALNNWHNRTKYDFKTINSSGNTIINKSSIPREMSRGEYKRFLEKRRMIKENEEAEATAQAQAAAQASRPSVTVAIGNNNNNSSSSSSNEDWDTSSDIDNE